MSMDKMRYSSFNRTANDATLEPMFLGQTVNVARYDKQKHEIFEKLTEKQLSFFWRPEEIDVSRDRLDFMKLPEHEKHIFTSNLKYQTLLDSVQGRAPDAALLPLVSIPELETWITTWVFSEAVHSRSYTHIIRNIYNDPSAVLDTIVENPAIMARAEAVTKYYDDLIEYGQWYNLLGEGMFTVTDRHTGEKKEVEITLRELKKKLYLCIMCINILEAIRFYVSFACSFAFAERETMEGNAKIIKLIARDECLTGDHEVLTYQGWLPISELQEGMPIVQFKDDYTSEFVVPSRIVRTTSRELHYYEGPKMSQVVTPSHRMVYSDRSGRIRTALSDTYIPNTMNFTPVTSELVGDQQRMTTKEKLLVAIAERGSHKSVVNGKLRVEMRVRFHRYRDVLQEYCDELNIPFTKEMHTNFDDEGQILSGGFVRGYIELPHNLYHNIDFEDYASMFTFEGKSAAWCKELVDTACFWSGKTSHRGEDTVQYDAHTKKNAEFIQAAGALSGYQSHYHKGKRAGLTVKFFDHRLSTRNNSVTKRRVHSSEESDVYCVTVPSGMFLVRHNGKVSATGNCLHMAGTQHILNLMRTGASDPEMAEIAEECGLECVDMFYQAAEQEKEWARYLFQDGSMIGLNYDILAKYVEFLTNTRMQAVGLPTIFDTMSNPIPWINAWLTSDNVQVAPQEVEISSYLIGQIDATVDTDTFGDMDI